MATTETGRSGLIPETFLRILSSQTPFSGDPFGASAPQDDPFSGGDPFAGQAAFLLVFGAVQAGAIDCQTTLGVNISAGAWRYICVGERAQSTAYDDPFAGTAADDPFAEPAAGQDPFAGGLHHLFQGLYLNLFAHGAKTSVPVASICACGVKCAFCNGGAEQEQSGVRIRHAPRPSLLNFDPSQFATAAEAEEALQVRRQYPAIIV